MRAAGADPGQVRAAGLLRRVWNSLNPGNRGDFSHQVHKAMAGCLACKACAGQCPVKVDVPDFRARFLAQYHGRYLRPLRQRLLAEVEGLLPLAARLPFAYAMATQGRLGRRVMRAIGLTALPPLPPGRQVLPLARPGRHGPETVIFVADRFTATFDPAVLQAAADLARALGLRPLFAPLANGKPLHVQGLLGRFKARAGATARKLQGFGDAVLVGLDPSMTLTYRQEYDRLGLAVPVLLPQEWLAPLAHRLPPLALPPDLRLMLHCTERATLARAGADWQAVFAALGARLTLPAAGCCGMAGTFGHELVNRPVAEALFAASWAAPLTEGTVMATGFSCRAQAHEIARRHLPHPLQLLAAALPPGNIHSTPVSKV